MFCMISFILTIINRFISTYERVSKFLKQTDLRIIIRYIVTNFYKNKKSCI